MADNIVVTAAQLRAKAERYRALAASLTNGEDARAVMHEARRTDQDARRLEQHFRH